MKKAQRTGGYTWPVDAEENIAQTLAQFFYLTILSINLKESSETPFLRGLIICFYRSYHFLLQKNIYDTQIKIGTIPHLFTEEGCEDEQTQEPGNL
jgi:hypothetical protein